MILTKMPLHLYDPTKQKKNFQYNFFHVSKSIKTSHGISLLFWYKWMKYFSLFDSSKKIRDYFSTIKGPMSCIKPFFFFLGLVYKQHYSIVIHSSYFSNTKPYVWGRFFSNPHTLTEGLLQGNSSQWPPFWWSWKSHTSQMKDYIRLYDGGQKKRGLACLRI